MRATRLVALLVLCCALALTFAPERAAAGNFWDTVKSWWGKIWNKPNSSSTTLPPRPASVPKKYWRLTFFDDFKGKPSNSANDTFCYDQVRPQCHIWGGGNSFDCDLAQLPLDNVSHIPPLRENLAAAVQTQDTSRNWSTTDLATVKNRYSQLVTENLRHLNKCTWTLYQVLNWMGTDYSGHWSSRFDPLMVRVLPEGKGYLELSAMRAPTTGAGECKDNIVYSPALKFNNLSCNILNGGLMSMQFNPVQTPGAPVIPRGFSQKFGRFEAKMRIVQGKGAFPAAWLMPLSGGWPYSGGEIDVLEARDGGDEIYQTQHHGKCWKANGATDFFEAVTYWDALGAAQLLEPNVCGNGSALCVKDYRTQAGTLQTNNNRACAGTHFALSGYSSMNISRGYTEKDAYLQKPGMFRDRDHVFAAEWTPQGVDWTINNIRTHFTQPGSAPTGNYATGGGAAQLPPALNNFAGNNFPVSPMYWILNHSTWVQPADRAAFATQKIYIDYIKVFSQCTTNAEFCPCGGAFTAGTGCVLGAGRLACPAGEPLPAMTSVNGQRVYASVCALQNQDCPHGGAVAGPNCQVKGFERPEVVPGVAYTVDTDPRWKGIYYKQIGGACPLGGVLSGGGNCQFLAFPARGVNVSAPTKYWVDTDTRWPGVYYKQVGGACPGGGLVAGGGNCQLLGFRVPPVVVKSGVAYWADSDPRWPGVYYKQVGGQCPHGGLVYGGGNCQLTPLPPGTLEAGVKYWIDADPRWAGIYYAPEYR